jgi:hypothetical protein
MNITKTVMAVVAFTLITGNVQADLVQDFQTRLADEAKLEWDFKQLVQLNCPGFTVWVSPWHLSVFGPFEYTGSNTLAEARARYWALQGLHTFKDSVYFETSYSYLDQKYEVHVDRRDYASEQAIANEMRTLVNYMRRHN